MQKDLGSWQKQCLKKGISEQGDAAQMVINRCSVSEIKLQSQWANQQTAQLSIRTRKYSVNSLYL